jgi:hypothetical protein
MERVSMRLAVLAGSLAVAGMLGGMAGSAAANEKDDSDIRCIVAFLNQAGADSSKADSASYIAAYFYGKLFTRNPGKPPASLVSDRSIPSTPEMLQTDLNRCAREFADAKTRIEALNAELLGRAHKLGGPGSAPSPAPPAPQTAPQTAPLPAIPEPKPWQGQLDPATRP